MQQAIRKRLIRLVTFQGGSMLALATVGMFFHLLMTATGSKS